MNPLQDSAAIAALEQHQKARVEAAALREVFVKGFLSVQESTFLMTQEADGKLGQKFIPYNDAIAMLWAGYNALIPHLKSLDALPSPSHEEMVEVLGVAIAETLHLIPNGTTWEDRSEILTQAAIAALSPWLNPQARLEGESQQKPTEAV